MLKCFWKNKDLRNLLILSWEKAAEAADGKSRFSFFSKNKYAGPGWRWSERAVFPACLILK